MGTLVVFLISPGTVFPASVDPPAIAGKNTGAGKGALLSQKSSFKIPVELGSVEESFRGTNGKTIIYIQDAHDSLEAQENIAKMIHYLVAHDGVKIVFEEGYEGPVPTDQYFGKIKDPNIKEKVAYFLMDKLRIGGAEYAHITRFDVVDSDRSSVVSQKKSSRLTPQNTRLKYDFQLIGADSLILHKENIKKYQESARYQQQTEKDLAVMGAAIRKLAQRHFTRDLKEWMGLRERFDRREIQLLDYLHRTQTLFLKGIGFEEFGAKYPTILLLLSAEKTRDEQLLGKLKNAINAKTLFEEINQLEDDYAGAHLKNASDRKIFHYYKLIQLLKRLGAIEVTAEEYQAVKQNLKEMDTAKIARFLVNQSSKSVVLSKTWETHLQSAVGFYETAEKRDGALGRSLGSWAVGRDGHKGVLTQDSQPKTQDPAAVLVYGGFHKEAIKTILRRGGFSYYIVTPKITSISVKHQNYYKQLMRMGYDSVALPRLVARATRAPDLLEFAASGPKSEIRVEGLIQQIAEMAGAVRGRDLPEMDLLWNQHQASLQVLPSRRSEVRNELLPRDQRNSFKGTLGEFAMHSFSVPIQMVEIAPTSMHYAQTSSLEKVLEEMGLLKSRNQEHAFFDDAEEQRLLYQGGHCDACIDTSLKSTVAVAHSFDKKLEINLPLDQIYIGPEDFQGDVAKALELKREYAERLKEFLITQPHQQANWAMFWDDEMLHLQVNNPAEPITIVIHFYTTSALMLKRIVPGYTPTERSEDVRSELRSIKIGEQTFHFENIQEKGTGEWMTFAPFFKDVVGWLGASVAGQSEVFIESSPNMADSSKDGVFRMTLKDSEGVVLNTFILNYITELFMIDAYQLAKDYQIQHPDFDAFAQIGPILHEQLRPEGGVWIVAEDAGQPAASSDSEIESAAYKKMENAGFTLRPAEKFRTGTVAVKEIDGKRIAKIVDLDTLEKNASLSSEMRAQILTTDGQAFDEIWERYSVSYPADEDPRVWPVEPGEEAEIAQRYRTLTLQELGAEFRRLLTEEPSPFDKPTKRFAAEIVDDVDLLRHFIDGLSTDPYFELQHHVKMAARGVEHFQREILKKPSTAERLQPFLAGAFRHKAFIRELSLRWTDIGDKVRKEGAQSGAGANESSKSLDFFTQLPILVYHFKDLEMAGLKFWTYGNQARVFRLEGWPFVLKEFTDFPGYAPLTSITTAAQSYRIARRKLGGLVPEFSFIKLLNEFRSSIPPFDDTQSWENGVVMEMLDEKNVLTQVEEAWQAGDLEGVDQLLRAVHQVISSALSRGVLPKDPQLYNFGTKNGRVLINDPGDLTEDFTDEDIGIFLSRLSSLGDDRSLAKISPDLADRHLRLLAQAGLTTETIRSTLSRLHASKEPAQEITRQAEEVMASLAERGVPLISFGPESLAIYDVLRTYYPNLHGLSRSEMRSSRTSPQSTGTPKATPLEEATAKGNDSAIAAIFEMIKQKLILLDRSQSGEDSFSQLLQTSKPQYFKNLMEFRMRLKRVDFEGYEELLQSEPTAAEEIKFYAMVLRGGLNRRTNLYETSRLDDDADLEAYFTALFDRKISDNDTKPLVFRFTALGGGGSGEHFLSEFQQILRYIDRYLRKTSEDPKVKAVTAQKLHLTFNFYDLRPYILSRSDDSYQQLTRMYSWLQSAEYSFEVINFLMPGLMDGWADESTVLLMARHLSDSTMDYFYGQVSRAMVNKGLLIVDDVTSERIKDQQDNPQSQSAVKDFVIQPHRHDDPSYRIQAGYSYRILKRVGRSESNRSEVRNQKGETRKPNVNLMNLQELKEHLGSIPKLVGGGNDKKEPLAKFIYEKGPYRNIDELKTALSKTGISGMTKPIQAAVAESFRAGINRKQFFTAVGVGIGGLIAVPWWLLHRGEPAKAKGKVVWLFSPHGVVEDHAPIVAEFRALQGTKRIIYVNEATPDIKVRLAKRDPKLVQQLTMRKITELLKVYESSGEQGLQKDLLGREILTAFKKSQKKDDLTASMEIVRRNPQRLEGPEAADIFGASYLVVKYLYEHPEIQTASEQPPLSSVFYKMLMEASEWRLKEVLYRRKDRAEFYKALADRQFYLQRNFEERDKAFETRVQEILSDPENSGAAVVISRGSYHRAVAKKVKHPEQFDVSVKETDFPEELWQVFLTEHPEQTEGNPALQEKQGQEVLLTFLPSMALVKSFIANGVAYAENVGMTNAIIGKLSSEDIEHLTQFLQEKSADIDRQQENPRLWWNGLDMYALAWLQEHKKIPIEIQMKLGAAHRDLSIERVDFLIETNNKENSARSEVRMDLANPAEDLKLLRKAAALLEEMPLIKNVRGFGIDDLRLSTVLAEAMIKNPMGKVFVVGTGLRKLPVLLALMGKQVFFLDVEPPEIHEVKKDWRKIRKALKDKDTGGLQPNFRIKTFESEFGDFDVKQARLLHQMDAVTLIGLAGGNGIVGDAENWFLNVKKLLKSEGSLVIDQSRPIVKKRFERAFPESARELLHPNPFQDTYNHSAGRSAPNDFYWVKNRSEVRRVFQKNTDSPLESRFMQSQERSVNRMSLMKQPLPRPVVFSVEPNQLTKEAWQQFRLEVTGWSFHHAGKISVYILDGTTQSDRVEQLRNDGVQVYEGSQFGQLPENAGYYHFSSLEDTKPAWDRLKGPQAEKLKEKLGRGEAKQYWGFFRGALGVALLEELNEGPLPGVVRVGIGYKYDAEDRYASDSLGALMAAYEVTLASA